MYFLVSCSQHGFAFRILVRLKPCCPITGIQTATATLSCPRSPGIRRNGYIWMSASGHAYLVTFTRSRFFGARSDQLPECFCLRLKTMLFMRSTQSAAVKFGAVYSASPYLAARSHAETSTRSELPEPRSSMHRQRRSIWTPRFRTRPVLTIFCLRCLSRTAQLLTDGRLMWQTR